MNQSLTNRSVPTDILLPHIFYRDVSAAIEWLEHVFGFVEHYRYGTPVSGAQLRAGSGWIMVAEARGPGPAELGYGTQCLTVFTEDVEAHFLRVKTAGGRIVEDLHETVYGEFQFAVEDLDGHRWIFSRHARDLSPDEWGAQIR
jgi:uncharacterized glyoxalase superfamily protein PhnB